MTPDNTLSDELSEECPECESEDIEWGHDGEAASQYCNECEAYVRFVYTGENDDRFEAVCDGCGLNTIVEWDGQRGLCDICRMRADRNV